MALAVAMIAGVAVGRRVLPALVDGGHRLLLLFLSPCVFGRARRRARGAIRVLCAFGAPASTAQRTQTMLREALVIGLSKPRTCCKSELVLRVRALTIRSKDSKIS